MNSTNTDMWNDTHFPSAMRSLSPSTRQKAIEIANQLITQGDLSKQQAVVVSIEEARRIARQSITVNEATHIYVAAR